MEGLDFWRLCDELTVIQAALLVVGVDPAGVQEHIETWDSSKFPVGYEAAIAAIGNAIIAGRLSAAIRRSVRDLGWQNYDDLSEDESVRRDERGAQIVVNKYPDWKQTTVRVENLKTWLTHRGFATGFFFPDKTLGPEYLNKDDACFSLKLAAAIESWEAVRRDPAAKSGKSVKQALLIWLRKNADRFGLTKEDGLPNEQGIEEVAKIANWDTKGGAPRTPGE
jgi:hypothetical protein